MRRCRASEYRGAIAKGGLNGPCPGCGESMATSALTHAFLDDTGFEEPAIYFGEKTMHVHGVAIVHRSQLSVRAALGRYWRPRLYRARSTVRRLVQVYPEKA